MYSDLSMRLGRRRCKRCLLAILVCVPLSWLIWLALPDSSNAETEMSMEGDSNYLVDIRRVFDTLQEPVTSGKIPIFVVEEHHEVIPYWFMAANRGWVPRKGVTLVHIDGHSDISPASYVEGYPTFRWPLDRELIYLMQRNDVFIQTAAMTGLINRVIWIWPEWDKPGHDQEYTMTTLKLGETTILQEGVHVQEFCMCLSEGRSLACYRGIDNGDVDEYFAVVKEKDCHIKNNIIMEEIHEKTAAKMLLKQRLLTEDEHFILDIDEDYYGCTYAVEPLLSANISLWVVQAISDTVGKIFCPLTTDSERKSEQLLQYVIDNCITVKNCKAKMVSRCDSLRLLDADEVRDLFKQHDHDVNLCSLTARKMTRTIRSLLNYFQKRTIQQLNELKATGFCSDTTPKTGGSPSSQRTFGICTGANTPENSVVLRHEPTLTEIKERTNIFTVIMRQLKNQPPDLVTLCRSVRDGYTPRQYFNVIEDSILTAIQNTFTDKVSIHYDKDLIGGPGGWYSRSSNVTGNV